MKLPCYLLRAAALGSLAVVLVSSVAQADIMGFGNFSGFSINKSDNGAPVSVSLANESITLTDTGGDESRSIFATTPQSVGDFTASFTYQMTNVVSNLQTLQGASFVIEHSSLGAAATGSDTGFGYVGIGSSVGIEISSEQPVFGGPVTYTTVGQNGSLPTPASTSPVSLALGDPINVVLSYNGSLLEESLTDAVTNAKFSTDYVLGSSLSSIIGSPTAYVGFTAGTVNGADQTISNFEFTSVAVPEPSTLALLGVGAISLLAYGWKWARVFSLAIMLH